MPSSRMRDTAATQQTGSYATTVPRSLYLQAPGTYPVPSQPAEQKHEDCDQVQQRQLPVRRQRPKVLHDRQARRILGVVVLAGVVELVVEVIDASPLTPQHPGAFRFSRALFRAPTRRTFSRRSLPHKKVQYTGGRPFPFFVEQSERGERETPRLHGECRAECELILSFPPHE